MGYVMKMLAEYLEHAGHFEQMAAEAKDAQFKRMLLDQAAAYEKLAEKRIEKLHLSKPPPPKSN